MDIVQVNWIALGASVDIINSEEYLAYNISTRFPKKIISEIEIANNELREGSPKRTLFEDYIKVNSILDSRDEVVKEVRYQHDNRLIHRVKSGLFQELWIMGELIKRGIRVDITKVLIRQEIIELANYININPYKLECGECYLIMADDVESICDDMRDIGIPVSVIGSITNDKARYIYKEGHISYLDRQHKSLIK